MVATVDGAAGARLAQRPRKIFFCECSLNLPMSSLARHEPLFPAPMSRSRKHPDPSELPATTTTATRRVVGFRCAPSPRSSSRTSHTKSPEATTPSPTSQFDCSALMCMIVSCELASGLWFLCRWEMNMMMNEGMKEVEFCFCYFHKCSFWKVVNGEGQ